MTDTIITLCLDAMRTTFEFVLASPQGVLGEGALRDAGDAALREIADAEARLSLFRPDSLLAHINRTAHRGPVRLDADTFDLLHSAREVWRLSDGAFDPTVAPRMTALGLHQHAVLPEHVAPMDPGAVGTASTVDTVADASSAASFGDVLLDASTSTVRFGVPMALDLGAIAKGHALDLAGRTLREAGITCALLHAGTSSVRAIGAPTGEASWRVAIREPEAFLPNAGHAARAAPKGGMVAALGSHASESPPESMLAPANKHATRGASPARVITLRDNALGISAHHGRMIDSPAGPVTHVLDPRTGLPAVQRARLAAVIAPSAALADAWSTAALVLGTRPAGMPRGMECIVLE